MAISSLAAPYLSAILAAGALGAALLGWWAALAPRLAVALLAVSLIAGQTLRFPLPGQGGGLLVSDVAVVLVLFAAARKYYRSYQLPITRYRLLLLLLPFILWSLFTLLVRVPQLGSINSLIAASYWVRLTVYLLLLPALLVLWQDATIRTFSRKTLGAAIFTLLLLGFFQLLFLSDLGPLTAQGWDPHQARLVSTWLDPNFFGAFLVIALPYLIASVRQMKNLSMLQITNDGSQITLLLLALALTRSRSSLLALAAMLLVFLFLLTLRAYHQKISVHTAMRAAAAVGLIIAWGFLAALLLGERVWGIVQFDPTVVLRFESLGMVWSALAERRFLVGVGYNAYQFAAHEAGIIEDFTIHSRAGADNSWLTLWVTTGVIGIILFLLPWVAMMRSFIRRWLLHGSRESLAATLAFSALFIHSQFVNSFLYGHLLIVLIIIFALAASSFPEPRTSRPVSPGS